MSNWNPEKIIVRGKNIPVVSIGNSYHDTIKMLSSQSFSISNVYEFRYDLMGGKLENIPDFVKRLNDLGIRYIFTYRKRGENAEVFYEEAVKGGADLIDVDLSLSPLTSRLDCRKIISFHGPMDSIDRRVKEMLAFSPFMVKVAPEFSSMDEFINALPKILRIEQELEIPFCFSPMGKIPGMRLFASLFLSDICYVRAGKPTAEGQPTIAQYEDFMNIVRKNDPPHV